MRAARQKCNLGDLALDPPVRSCYQANASLQDLTHLTLDALVNGRVFGLASFELIQNP